MGSSITNPTATDFSRNTAARPRLLDRAAEEEYAKLFTKPIMKQRGF